MSNLDVILQNWRTERIPVTIANRTRRVYDLLAGVYPLSSYFFHAKAHRVALAMSGIEDGMKILEVAVGSGEMFNQLLRLNPNGVNVGLDLSPRMAAVTQKRIRTEFPGHVSALKAADARAMPFRDGSFDVVLCCYLLELLASQDIVRTLHEIHRVLKPGGTFTVILIGQNQAGFNRAYRIASKLVPAFWGQQMEHRAQVIFEACGFGIVEEQALTQTGYPSRIVLTRRS